MICDSKCCRRSGEKIWCKKNLGLKGLIEAFFQFMTCYVCLIRSQRVFVFLYFAMLFLNNLKRL